MLVYKIHHCSDKCPVCLICFSLARPVYALSLTLSLSPFLCYLRLFVEFKTLRRWCAPFQPRSSWAKPPAQIPRCSPFQCDPVDTMAPYPPCLHCIAAFCSSIDSPMLRLHPSFFLSFSPPDNRGGSLPPHPPFWASLTLCLPLSNSQSLSPCMAEVQQC